MSRTLICEYLLLIFPHCVNSTDKQGQTPLHYAHQLKNTYERVKFTTMLISAGANEDITDMIENLPGHNISNSARLSSCLSQTSENEMKMREDNLEYLMMNLDFDARKFPEMESIQCSGRMKELRIIIAKNLHNERFIQYIKRFRQQQNRLGAAMIAIEKNELKKLRNLVDDYLIEAKNSEVLFYKLILILFVSRRDVFSRKAYKQES
ncbi:unnamed protein product [Thelazia callipaeda]|uniref:ANK_REP_REGION domain-containing protein n=1 Tax=Thelazia callipaeda TaxID=103827 RepID=A0A0N5CSU2_THECL|nr:unnamed protein product [Thelazia callipaeda]